MDFWFDWWTSTGVWFVLIMFYSIWQLLKMESTMSLMLAGFYLDILSMTSFFIKIIYFSSINENLLVVFKMSGYSENGAYLVMDHHGSRKNNLFIQYKCCYSSHYIFHGILSHSLVEFDWPIPIIRSRCRIIRQQPLVNL
jgi:hypothetical protein